MNHPAERAELPPLPSPERLQELFFDAARIGRDDMIPALLRAGVDMEAQDPRCYTALILASYNGQSSTTALLLQEGAMVDAPDGKRGNTALMGVAFKGYDRIARMLIESGASVDRRNAAGQTALMNAAMFGHTAIVDLLLAHGADPHARDDAGNSPIGVARAQGNAAMAERIEQRGVAASSVSR